MSGRTVIYSIEAEHTTGRYFCRAAEDESGGSVAYCHVPPDVGQLQQRDTFLFVDPATDWPIGLERADCVTAAYMIDVHQGLDGRLRVAPLFDAVFVAQKDYIEAFRRDGHPNVHWLPLACAPRVHHQPSEARPLDVAFVGKPGLKGSRRETILAAVLPHYKTNDWGQFHSPTEMAAIYGCAKIVFNASINGDLNMRFFEALASGALLITDRLANGLEDLFREGVHYVGYSSVAEAREKIDYYLAHDAERARIAAAGCEEVLARHTYGHRLNNILAVCATSRNVAPARAYGRSRLGTLHAQTFASMRRPDRMREVMRRYGASFGLALHWAASWAKHLNARIPLTPGAIRARLRS
jgi:hypothetical protein